MNKEEEKGNGRKRRKIRKQYMMKGNRKENGVKDGRKEMLKKEKHEKEKKGRKDTKE